MQRRTTRRRAPARKPDPPVHSCLALIPTDGTAIRKKIQKAYAKAQRELETSQRKLDHFQQVDQPAYTRWLTANFGPLLTEIRELDRKVSEDRSFIYMVETHAGFTGTTCAQAYARAMQPQEDPDPAGPSAEPDEGNDPEDPPREGDPGSDSRTAREKDPFETLFNDLFGDDWPDWEEFDEPGSDPGPHPTPPTSAHTENRLKELYRTLVLRLHPDRHPDMDARKLEFWHQTQTAYKDRNVDQLEIILALCDMEEAGTTAHTSASLLQRITEQARSAAREIKRLLKEMRRDPAWNFSNRDDHDDMVVRWRQLLEADLEELRLEDASQQALLAQWKAAAERSKAKMEARAKARAEAQAKPKPPPKSKASRARKPPPHEPDPWF